MNENTEMQGKSKQAPSLMEKLGCELHGWAGAAQKHEADMSQFRGLEHTATKMGRISPMYLMPVWEVIGVKQMHRSNVSLHLPPNTRIPMLIRSSLCTVQDPERPCSAALFHLPNTARLLNQLEKTVVPRGGGQGVNTFLTPTVAHFML